ncbi:glycosyltransferase family 4 protein, partial [Parapusillimonas sp. SGNA-6]|nr:glycosyltransferase family 4 protein [Parapusillimonas sp. SGNA-6]
MKYIFFTLRDFNKVGGGAIRIYGVLNALAESGKQVVLISNAKNHDQFHPSIRHITLHIGFKRKALLQGLLAFLPSTIMTWLFPQLFSRCNDIFTHVDQNNSKLFFFEYLDNSIGYILKRSGIINHYVNDVHGVSTIEFDYLRKNTTSIVRKVIYHFKYVLSERLDRKVFEYADGIIYSSDAMRKYFEDRYNIRRARAYVLPNLLSGDAGRFGIDEQLRDQLLQDMQLLPDSFVFLFAGGYKPTSGVDDLVEVFHQLLRTYPHLRLILIGDGPLKKKVCGLIETKGLSDAVIMIDSVPYALLTTYQSLANVLVCPDRYNAFSNLIIHLKYLDSLISNRIVVNSRFDSVDEINKDDKLSVNFAASD